MTPWSTRRLLVAAAALALLTAGVVGFVDVPLAVACARVAPEVTDAIRAALRVVEVLILLDRPKLTIVVGLGVLGLAVWRWRPSLGRALIFVGLTHVSTRYAVNLVKAVAERHRPNEVPFNPAFFQEGGISFPSGHAGHVFGLFFALLVVAPRAAWAWAPVAIYVAAARVVPNDHFLGDVTGAMALAALFAALLAPIYRGWGRPSESTTGKSLSASSQKSVAK